MDNISFLLLYRITIIYHFQPRVQHRWNPRCFAQRCYVVYIYACRRFFPVARCVGGRAVNVTYRNGKPVAAAFLHELFCFVELGKAGFGRKNFFIRHHFAAFMPHNRAEFRFLRDPCRMSTVCHFFGCRDIFLKK